MSVYYPQAAVTMKIIWEDYDSPLALLTKDQYEFEVLCRRVEVKLNDYTKADTFSLEIDYKNFPFDPRVVRSLGITIHIENMKSLSKDGRLNQIKPSKDNTVFTGFADEESIDFDDTTRTVQVEGRDFTSFFIDREFPKKPPLDVTKPLDDIIKGFIKDIPGAEKITLDLRLGNPLIPISPLAPGLPSLGSVMPNWGKYTGQKNSRSGKESYWDVIQNIIGKTGLIVYMELEKLVITEPRSLYDPKEVKQFIYGKNIKNLSFKRKIGKQKGFNIRVISLNLESEKGIISAKIPEEASEVWAKSIGIKRERVKIHQQNADGSKGRPKDAPFLTFRLANIVGIETIKRKGESIFEELSRQELEGSYETKEMCIKSKNPKDPTGITSVEFDITKMKIGTPVKIDIDPEDKLALGNLKDKFNAAGANKVRRDAAKGDIVRFLTKKCYPTNVALAFAESLGKFKTRFYTKSVTFNVTAEEGFTMQSDFINFIETDDNLLGF